MFSLLKVPKEKISDKFIQDVKERVTSVQDQDPGVSEEDLFGALVKGFTSGKGFEFSKATEQEVAAARELSRERYSTDEWNFMR